MWKVLWCGARELCCWLHARLRHALHIAGIGFLFSSIIIGDLEIELPKKMANPKRPLSGLTSLLAAASSRRMGS